MTIKNVYTAWHKCMRIKFCLPNTTHNYIISHLDYNIMERLDRRLDRRLVKDLMRSKLKK